MLEIIDLSGQVFGRWTVIDLVIEKNRDKRWNCICLCGVTKQVYGSALRRGLSTSCGCYREELRTVPGRMKDGKTSPTYNSWSNMIGRCTRPSQPDYDKYGGRGISVCDSWKESFTKFREDMGERPDGKTIDRKNTNGNYELSNCKWSDNIEQQNNRNNNVIVNLNGKDMGVREYSEKTGISIQTVRNRLFAGVPKDKLHLTPKQCGL